MSEQPSGGEVRTIAVRVTPAFKQQIDSVVGLTGLTLNDAGIEAFKDWVAKTLADPEIRERARQDLEERKQALEAEAAALEGLIGEDGDVSGKPETARKGRNS